MTGISKSFQSCYDPRPGIEAALEKAIALSRGSKRYAIADGQLVYEQHRCYRYAFSLVEESSWELPDGTDLQLSSSDFVHPLPVELSCTKDLTVTITVVQRLPERTLASAQLAVDRAFLLRKMKDALNSLASSAQLGLKLFGYLDCPDVVAAPHLVETIADVFTPDNAQRLAIQRALGSELLMILGPPGTGKTDVLAAIAMLHALLYKSRVLITSHTNIAIDNAIIRLTGFMRKHGLEHWLDDQCVVRYGDPHLAELETDPYRNVTMPLIVADYIQHPCEEIARLEHRHEEVLDQIAKDQEELPERERAWQQRKVTLSQQRNRVVTDLETLEVDEHRRLAPMMEQLIPLLEKGEQVKQCMSQALASWRAGATRLQLLQRDYQRQLKPYQAECKKLERLRKYKSVIASRPSSLRENGKRIWMPGFRCSQSR